MIVQFFFKPCKSYEKEAKERVQKIQTTISIEKNRQRFFLSLNVLNDLSLRNDWHHYTILMIFLSF